MLAKFAPVFLVAIVGLGVGIVDAAISTTCTIFNNPGKNTCTAFVNEFCSSLSTLNLTGQETVSRCFSTGAMDCTLTARNVLTNSSGLHFSASNCQSVLNRVTRNCSTGAGSGSSGGNFDWFVSGSTPPGCQINVG